MEGLIGTEERLFLDGAMYIGVTGRTTSQPLLEVIRLVRDTTPEHDSIVHPRQSRSFAGDNSHHSRPRRCDAVQYESFGRMIVVDHREDSQLKNDQHFLDRRPQQRHDTTIYF